MMIAKTSQYTPVYRIYSSLFLYIIYMFGNLHIINIRYNLYNIYLYAMHIKHKTQIVYDIYIYIYNMHAQYMTIMTDKQLLKLSCARAGH